MELESALKEQSKLSSPSCTTLFDESITARTVSKFVHGEQVVSDTNVGSLRLREYIQSFPFGNVGMMKLLDERTVDPETVSPQWMGQVIVNSKVPLEVSKPSTTTKYEP